MNFSKNIPRLYAFSFLKMTLFPMAVITLFWKDQIGLSLTEIMVLQGLFSLTTLLAEYPSGYLSDRWGYRFSLSLASLLGIAGWGLYTAANSFVTVLEAEILLGLSYAFVSGADSALLYESLRQKGEEQRYAFFDGRMVGFAQGGEAAGALLAGIFYAWWPVLPFLLQVGVWVLALGITRTLREPTRDQLSLPPSHLENAWRICRTALLHPGPQRSTILFATVLGITSFYPVWLIQPYMQQTGVPIAWFGPIWAGANLTVAVFSLFSHRCHFQFGTRGSAILFIVLVATGYLGLGLAGGIWSFLFYYVLTAMRGLQGPLTRSLLLGVCDSGERASILSLKSFAFRLLFVATAPIIGWLADTIGLKSTFLGLAFLFLVFLPPLGRSFWRVHRVAKIE